MIAGHSQGGHAALWAGSLARQVDAGARRPRHARARPGQPPRRKVPEITVWFWVIKILCTTVGESFADWINMHLASV